MTRGEISTALPADQHIPDEALELYAMNRLPETDTEGLETHLLTCERCQERLKDVDEYVKAVRAALRELRSERGKTFEPAAVSRFAAWFWLRPAYTLSAVFAICLVVLVLPRIQQQPSPPQQVYLHSYRGAGSSTAEAGRSLVLFIDTTGLAGSAAYVLQVVDSSGRVLVQAETAVESGSSLVRLPLAKALKGGKYWVRVCDRDNPATVLRETGLTVR